MMLLSPPSNRTRWFPKSAEEIALVQQELEHLLQESTFANSKRYPAFLRFIVEATLSGRADELKERSLGIDVFHRSPDYDTSNDTVVRFTAGEVRKRLTAFYAESSEQRPIQIILQPGSYIPEFYRELPVPAVDPPEPASPSVMLEPSTARLPDPEPESESRVLDLPGRDMGRVLVQSGPRSRLQSWRVLLPALVVVFAAAIFGLFKYMHQSDLDEFWNPLGASSETVIFSPGASMYAGDPPVLTAADSTHQNVWVSLESATTLTMLGSLFAQTRHYTVQPTASLTLTDLRKHPVVLIGAYNNDWTIRLTSGLRLHFAPKDGPREIVDEKNPGQHWRGEINGVGVRISDYALVARYHDALTENSVVVIAGLNKGGTEAAAEFLTKAKYFDSARSQLPRGWQNKNLEFVLETKLIGGKTSAPKIVAVHTW